VQLSASAAEFVYPQRSSIEICSKLEKKGREKGKKRGAFHLVEKRKKKRRRKGSRRRRPYCLRTPHSRRNRHSLKALIQREGRKGVRKRKGGEEEEEGKRRP